MKQFRYSLLFALLMLMACQPSRQMQQAAPREVYYAPIRSDAINLTADEKRAIDELITRKMSLQNEIDRLTEASDLANQADAGQMGNLQQQMQQLNAEIKAYLSTADRQAYFNQQWHSHQK